jgi:A/G-specific adenine glycosylase
VPSAPSERIDEKCRDFISSLSAWRGEDYPWRRETDPYKIIITEMLLVRTRRDLVARIYYEFFTKYPTPCSLARAELSEIEQIVARLGLRKRAPYVKAAGEVLCAEGPGPEAIKKIKGIGPYIRDLLETRLFGGKKVAVDRNGGRLIYRYLTGDNPPPSSIPENSEEVKTFKTRCLDGRKNALEITYAIMDIGTSFCKNRNPQCEKCLLNRSCAFFAKHNGSIEK